MKPNSYDPKEYVRYSGYALLPAVEYSENLFPRDHLKNAYLIACHHILPSAHMMIRSMINLGLEEGNVALIGKCYSSDEKTMENMIKEGIFVCKSSIEFDSDKSFDQQFKESIISFLQSQIQRMRPSKDAKIIILDDGGALIAAAQYLAKDYINICGVEFTSSGYRRLAAMSLKFPVIDVAQSRSKLEFESPLIAKSVTDNLESKLNISSMGPKDILVVGSGAIGNAVRKMLKNECMQHNTKNYDSTKELSEIHHLDFSNFDIIIGATGNRIMSHNYYDSLREEAILVSVSSSDREFDGVKFRQLSGKKWNTHDDVYYNGLCLLNCGFPINFSGGGRVSVPLMQYQFFIAMLFIGVCEAVLYNKDDGQVIKLNNNFMCRTLNRYNLVA
jgi:S-adenosylhomocysteine hydrolase